MCITICHDFSWLNSFIVRATLSWMFFWRRQQGFEIIPVLSKGDDSWQGRRGYVQDIMKEDEEWMKNGFFEERTMLFCVGWCQKMLRTLRQRTKRVEFGMCSQERGEGFVLSAKHGAVLCGQKDMVPWPQCHSNSFCSPKRYVLGKVRCEICS